MNTKDERAREHAVRRQEYLEMITGDDPALLVRHLFRWFDSASRAKVFLELWDEFCVQDDVAFWRCVAAVWPSLDAIPHDVYARAFRARRTGWTADIMCPDDRSAYDGLPGTFTVYRGQSATDTLGLSWSLSRDVALTFARGHRGIGVPSPTVFSAQVRKTSVALFHGERGEDEVVLFRAPRRSAAHPAFDGGGLISTARG